MKKSKVKVIIIIIVTVLLCGTIAGTVVISGCSNKKTVNSIKNSSTTSVENNALGENSTTKENVEATTTQKTENGTEGDIETDEEDSQVSTEDKETTEAKDETTVTPTESPTKAPQPTTVAPTEAPTKAPQPTTVDPTEAPTKAPQPTTVVPTESPTEEPTTPPVIHGENGRILETIYFHYTEESIYGTWMIPQTREEFIQEVKGGDINDSTVAVSGSVTRKTCKIDFFGNGFLLGEATLNDIRAYYGEPYAIEYNSGYTVLFYEYKVEGLILYFMFNNTDLLWNRVGISIEEDAGIEESEKL